MKKYLIICLIAAISANCFGYYNPTRGRWLSRDPLGDYASSGALGLHGNLIKQMAHAAIVMLKMASNDRMDRESRLGALTEAIY